MVTRRMIMVSSRATDLDRYTELASESEAQRWLGWKQEDLRARTGALATPLEAEDMVLRLDRGNLFFAAIDQRTRIVVGGLGLSEPEDGSLAIGGVVASEFRGTGRGREMLQAVCHIAHRHFGIARLRAVCEVTNVASQRWLASAGFGPVAGPPTHTLPNGRVIEPVWRERVDPRARLRCRQLKSEPQLSA